MPKALSPLGGFTRPHKKKKKRIRILENLEIWGECLNPIEWQPSAQTSWQNENFVNTVKKILKNSN